MRTMVCKFSSIWIILVLMTAGAGTVLAQGGNDWEKDGGIPSAEVQIIKDRQITLPPADRSFEKIPPRPADPLKADISYQIRNIRFNTADYNPAIRPLKLKQEDIARLTGNYISVGYGNYASPFLDAAFNSKRNKNGYYGATFYHNSFGKGPVDDKNSASGTTELNLFGKAMSNSITVGGSLTYENRATHFYGYPAGTEPTASSIRQTYDYLGMNVGIENSKPADFNYALNGGYSYLTDHYKASETEFGLAFKSAYKFSEDASFILNADYSFIDHKDSISGLQPRHLFRVKPAYKFKAIERAWLTIGLNVAYENDDVGKNKSFHVYPNVRADYSLGKLVSAYAMLTGDIDKVSLQSLSRENLWLNSNQFIYHTNRSVDLTAGLKGSLSNKVAFGTGFAVANLKNLYFFRNSPTDQSKFDVIYDVGNVQRLNLFGELGYTYGETVKLAARADYYQYTTDKVADAYHRPTYRLDFNSTFNVYSKLVFNADLVAQGGMKAYDWTTAKSVSIDPAFDLNLKLDYFISRNVSAFIKLNNLLSNKYQVYYNYPVRGFQAMGGVTWTF